MASLLSDTAYDHAVPDLPAQTDPVADPRVRLARQSLLPDFGTESIDVLAGAHAAIVGLGALGSVAAELLARAGVGTLTIVDRDLVEATNLQRQLLYTERDARDRLPKTVAAERALRGINSTTTINAHAAHAGPGNIEGILGVGTDNAPTVILDGTDNFNTRLLLNDVAVKHHTPFIYTAAVGTRAMLATILPPTPDDRWTPTPCLRELVHEPPAPGAIETCDTAGVLSTVTAAVAAFQVTEALKILLGRFDKLRGHMLAFDPWNTEFQRIDMSPEARDPDCPCCGRREFIYLDATDADHAESLCGQHAVQLTGNPPADLDALERSLANLGETERTTAHVAVILDHEAADDDAIDETERGTLEIAVFADGRAIVTGTNDTDRARAVYDRTIGG